MNDRCFACDGYWEQRDFAVVIGHIDRERRGSLVMVHRNCLLSEVLGQDEAGRVIARERG